MNPLPHERPGAFRALIRRGARAPAPLQWMVATTAAVALVAMLWFALFSALARWEPGVRVAQAPALAANRAGAPDGSGDPSRIIAR